MIVTCPDCDTSFQLDESRIPQKGIRVRCSRCKHAFHLAHPSASKSEAIDAVAAEAAQSEGTSAPPVTQDLDDPNATSGTGPVRDEINNEDDAEWEFNEDIPSTDEDSKGAHGGYFGEASSASGIDLGADDGASGLDLAGDAPSSGLDLAGGAADDAGLDLAGNAGTVTEGSGGLEMGGPVAKAASEAAAPESDADQAFGSVDDFSSLMDDDPTDSLVGPEADGTADELRAQAAAQSAAPTDDAQSDDLGDPEKWDFFDGATPPSSPPPPQPRAQLGRVALRPAGAADDVTDDWQHAPVTDPTEPGRLARLAESAGRIVGWTVVITAFAVGLLSGLWGTAESFVTAEQRTPIGPLEAVDMRARWMDTARAGRLLVVTGGLRNPTRQAVPMPGPIEVALLDRMGDDLGLPPVSAGVVLSERQLRELPGEVLARVRSQAAIDLQSARVPAGGMLPFQVLIFDAPTSGLRYETRLAESGRLSLPEPVEEAEPVVPEPAVVEDAGMPGDALDPQGVQPAVEPADEAAMVDEAVPAAPAEAVGSEGVTPGAPGYDDPYGDDAGMGLQDL